MPNELLKNFLLDYMIMNELSSINITLQTTDVHKQLMKNSVFKLIKNATECKSYDWLYTRLGYYAVFGLTITKEMLINEWERIYTYIIPGIIKNYCYIFDSEKEILETNYKKWMDVQYLINEGSEEEYTKEKFKLNMSYITNLENSEFIQLIFKDIKKGDILDYIKYK